MLQRTYGYNTMMNVIFPRSITRSSSISPNAIILNCIKYNHTLHCIHSPKLFNIYNHISCFLPFGKPYFVSIVTHFFIYFFHINYKCYGKWCVQIYIQLLLNACFCKIKKSDLFNYKPRHSITWNLMMVISICWPPKVPLCNAIQCLMQTTLFVCILKAIWMQLQSHNINFYPYKEVIKWKWADY